MTTKEEITTFVINNIVKRLIDSNISAKTVYVVIHPHWSTDWADSIIEV